MQSCGSSTLHEIMPIRVMFTANIRKMWAQWLWGGGTPSPGLFLIFNCAVTVNLFGWRFVGSEMLFCSPWMYTVVDLSYCCFPVSLNQSIHSPLSALTRHFHHDVWVSESQETNGFWNDQTNLAGINNHGTVKDLMSELSINLCLHDFLHDTAATWLDE